MARYVVIVTLCFTCLITDVSSVPVLKESKPILPLIPSPLDTVKQQVEELKQWGFVIKAQSIDAESGDGSMSFDGPEGTLILEYAARKVEKIVLAERVMKYVYLFPRSFMSGREILGLLYADWMPSQWKKKARVLLDQREALLTVPEWRALSVVAPLDERDSSVSYYWENKRKNARFVLRYNFENKALVVVVPLKEGGKSTLVMHLDSPDIPFSASTKWLGLDAGAQEPFDSLPEIVPQKDTIYLLGGYPKGLYFYSPTEGEISVGYHKTSTELDFSLGTEGKKMFAGATPLESDHKVFDLWNSEIEPPPAEDLSQAMGSQSYPFTTAKFIIHISFGKVVVTDLRGKILVLASEYLTRAVWGEGIR